MSDPQEDQPIEPQDNPEPEQVQTPLPVEPSPTEHLEKEFSERTAAFIRDMNDDYKSVHQWCTSMLEFFTVRRQPWIFQIRATNRKLNQGEKAVNEAIEYFKFMYTLIKTQYDACMKTELYKQQLAKSEQKVPTIPIEAIHDYSVLDLSALVQYQYNLTKEYTTLMAKIENHIESLRGVLKTITKDTAKQIKQVSSSATQCTRMSEGVDKKLLIYSNSLNYYNGIQSGSYVESIRSSKRHNVFKCRNSVLNSVLLLWKSHDNFVKEAQQVTSNLIELDATRMQNVHNILIQFANDLTLQNNNLVPQLQYLTQTLAQTPVQASVGSNNKGPNNTTTNTQNRSPGVTVNNTLIEREPSDLSKIGGNMSQDVTFDSLLNAAQEVKAPGPFPSDATLVKEGRAVRQGVFSDKEHSLLYTKNHHIHLIEKSAVAGENVTSFNEDSLWEMDGAVTKATIDDKDKDVLVLEENHTGWFKRNHKHKLKMSSHQEAKNWADLINAHSTLFKS